MPKPAYIPFSVNLLVILSVIAFFLFFIRLVLFWMGVLPTFGVQIDSFIAFQWVLTFILDSAGLFFGRYLQDQYHRSGNVPGSVKGLIWILNIILAYQILSIVFKSWAGLAYVQILSQPEGQSPFQPK